MQSISFNEELCSLRRELNSKNNTIKRLLLSRPSKHDEQFFILENKIAITTKAFMVNSGEMPEEHQNTKISFRLFTNELNFDYL